MQEQSARTDAFAWQDSKGGTTDSIATRQRGKEMNTCDVPKLGKVDEAMRQVELAMTPEELGMTLSPLKTLAKIRVVLA